MRLLIRVAAALLSLVFAASVFAQTTVTLQQDVNGYTGTTDGRIASWSGNEGDGAYLRLDTEDVTGGLVRFAIFAAEGGPVPNGATITSATLSLWKNAGADAVFKASRLLKNWNESQATWSVAATGTPWQTAGARGATDVSATADGQGTFPATTGWMDINVTAGVQAFASGTPNYGWKIAWVSGSDPGTAKQIISSENTQFPTSRPKLTVTYTTGGCTRPTAQFTATPNPAGVNETVVFNASGSTDGSSAITSLRLLYGDGQEVTWSNKSQTQSHAYAASGIYTATLTATNGCGTSDPVTRQVQVGNPPPAANLAPATSSGAEPWTVTFNASGSSGTITSLRLQFGDGQEVTWSDKNTPQPHTYAAAGSYTATLTVTGPGGSATDTSQITVTTTDLPTEGRAVPTFHSIGLYWRPANAPLTNPDGTQKGVPVQYRVAVPNAPWQRGYDLWYDSRVLSIPGQPDPVEPARGSIVHAEPNTQYEIQFGRYDANNAVQWVAKTTATTENENFPIGEVVPLERTITTTSNTAALPIDSGGSAGAYKVYDGLQADGTRTRITAPTISNAYGIRVSDSYVIIRNVEVVGGQDAIRIDPGVHHVVIENCDISGWARWQNGSTRAALGHPLGANEDSGIKVPAGANSYATTNIVVQRCTIHDPAHGSDTWDRAATPPGPKAIDFDNTGGRHVIRYNEIYSQTFRDTGSVARLMQDGISGSSNDDLNGAPGPDSDIYMNRVENVADDCIEAEGGGMNVRVWKNYMTYCAAGIATTEVRVGPLYLWRNVFNRSRGRYGSSYTWDSDPSRFQAFKAGQWTGGGRRYVFHNSVLQESVPSISSFGLGHKTGIAGNTDQPNERTVSRNNLYWVWRSTATSISGNHSTNNYDFDLYNGSINVPSGQESNGISGVPDFKSGHGPQSFGRYQLEPASDGHDDGEELHNFNHGVSAPHQYLGVRPDRGAHEEGSADMRFGTTANGS